MPLPQFYRIIAYNDTGQTITYDNNGRLNVKMTAWKWDTSNGDIVYTQLSDDALGFGAGDSTAAGAEDKSSEIDNTSNEYVGLQVQLESHTTKVRRRMATIGSISMAVMPLENWLPTRRAMTMRRPMDCG
jgi:hypothetical protein